MEYGTVFYNNLIALKKEFKYDQLITISELLDVK